MKSPPKRRSPSKREALSPKARAVDLLSRREHAAEELIRKLAARGVDAAEAREAVEALASDGWQSDMRYSQAIARARASQGHGPRRIHDDLRRNGVAESVIDAALNAEAIDWKEVAQEWFSRRHEVTSDPRERARQWRQLAARGFDANIARSLIGGDADDD